MCLIIPLNWLHALSEIFPWSSTNKQLLLLYLIPRAQWTIYLNVQITNAYFKCYAFSIPVKLDFFIRFVIYRRQLKLELSIEKKTNFCQFFYWDSDVQIYLLSIWNYCLFFLFKYWPNKYLTSTHSFVYIHPFSQSASTRVDYPFTLLKGRYTNYCFKVQMKRGFLSAYSKHCDVTSHPICTNKNLE